jgi:hypothetical protein
MYNKIFFGLFIDYFFTENPQTLHTFSTHFFYNNNEP